ncbi:MAG: hypothetical protein RJP95_02105 [Pirellulales bacterium]
MLDAMLCGEPIYVVPGFSRQGGGRPLSLNIRGPRRYSVFVDSGGESMWASPVLAGCGYLAEGNGKVAAA